MKRPAYYLCGSSTGWTLYSLGHSESCGQPESPESPEPLEALADALDARGVCRLISEHADTKQQRTNAHVVIGLPAEWCLCATVSDTGIPSGSAPQTEQALHYRLEAALPITAEDYAIDLAGNGPEYLGVATLADRLLELVHLLEDEAHTVASITPRAFLAAQTWCTEESITAAEQAATFCWSEPVDGNAGSTQLIHLDPDRSPRWRMVDCPTTSIPGEEGLLAQLSIDGVIESVPDRLWLATPDKADQFAFLNQDGVALQELSNPFSAECLAVQKIVEHNEQAWINLCNGPLAPRYQWRRVQVPALSAVAAAMLLLATITASLFIRAEQYNQIAEQVDTQSAQSFAEAMPGQPVPTSPLRRLQTKLKQLRGESGIAGGDQLQDRSAPTLTVLHDLLVALPADQRFAVTDLRLEDDGLRMNGYARSHSEADQLANTIRQAGVFVVEPPSTDKLHDGGVRFSLEARHAGLDADSDAKPSTDPDSTPAPPALAGQTNTGGSR